MEFYSTVAQLIPVYLVGLALVGRHVQFTALRWTLVVMTVLSSVVLMLCLGVLQGAYDPDATWPWVFLPTTLIVGLGAVGLIIEIIPAWPSSRRKTVRSDSAEAP